MFDEHVRPCKRSLRVFNLQGVRAFEIMQRNRAWSDFVLPIVAYNIHQGPRKCVIGDMTPDNMQEGHSCSTPVKRFI